MNAVVLFTAPLPFSFATNSAPGVFYMENSALPEFASEGYLQNLKPVLTANTSYNLSALATCGPMTIGVTSFIPRDEEAMDSLVYSVML